MKPDDSTAPPAPRQQGQKNASSAFQRPRGRKIAEWVSLGISLLLILSLAGFLVYEGLRSSTPFVPVSAQVQIDRVELVDQQYILPIKLTNRGRQTLRSLKVRIGFDTRRPPEELTIDYLGEGSETTIYVYSDTDPRQDPPWARVLHYRLE